MITGNTYPRIPFRTYGGGEKSQSFLYAEAIWFWETNRHQSRIEDVDIKMQPQSINMIKQRESLNRKVIGAGFSEHPPVVVKDGRFRNQLPLESRATFWPYVGRFPSMP